METTRLHMCRKLLRSASPLLPPAKRRGPAPFEMRFDMPPVKDKAATRLWVVTKPWTDDMADLRLNLRC